MLYMSLTTVKWRTPLRLMVLENNSNCMYELPLEELIRRYPDNIIYGGEYTIYESTPLIKIPIHFIPDRYRNLFNHDNTVLLLVGNDVSVISSDSHRINVEGLLTLIYRDKPYIVSKNNNSYFLVTLCKYIPFPDSRRPRHYSQLTRFEYFRLHKAAMIIQNWWRNILESPYTEPGRRRINRDYDFLCCR